MPFRISPAWWPLIGLSSPVLFPMLVARNRRYKQNVIRSERENRERIERAEPLELPELERFELTVILEHKAEPGYLGAPGICYLIRTDQGSVLFDLGFGPEQPALMHNATQLNFSMDQANAVAISHLHPDHMGGFRAARRRQVTVPEELGKGEIPCFIPAEARTDGFQTHVVKGPRMLAAGLASTGPLTRSLFFMGWTEEQAIIAHLKHKGLIILTGCGHPTIETIVKMVKHLSRVPIYAIGGGLHFPVTDSPLRKPGLKIQMIWGTGKPPWKSITALDLQRTIEQLNSYKPQHVFLSPHDTCDYALDRFQRELTAETTVLRSGLTYRL